MKRISASFLAAVLCFGVASAQSARSSQNISNPHVTCITEDKNGYMWIGTLDGLNRYNGMEFISYRSEYLSGQQPSSLSNCINTICIDSRGRAWAGTPMGVNIAELDRLSYIGFSPVTAIRELDENNMIVSYDTRLSKVNSLTLKETTYYPKHAICVEVSSFSEIWTVVYENGHQVFKVLSSDLQELRTIWLQLDEQVRGSFKTEDGTIWFYTDRDIILFNPKTYASVKKNFSLTGQNRYIQFVTPYKPGYLLIGITGEGLYSYNCYTEETERVFHDIHLEDKESVAFVDANNSLWLSDSVDAIKIFSDTRVFAPIYHFLEHTRSNSIKSIQVDDEHNLWCIVGSELLSLNLDDGRVISHYTDRNYALIFIDSRGSLWTKENDSVVRCYTTNGGKLSGGMTYSFSEPVKTIIEDSEGTIWIQLDDHLVYLNEVGVFTSVVLPQSTEFHKLIRCEGSGDLMMTSENGLFVLGSDKQFSCLLSSGLFNPLSAVMDPDGCYWIGTVNGLVRFNPATAHITRFGKSDGLSASNIQATMIDETGNIWVVTEKDIIRYDRANGAFSHYVDRRFSDNNHFLPDCCDKADDGRMFFASTTGVVTLYPNDIPPHYDRPFELKLVKVGRDIFLEPQPYYSFKHNQNALNFWCSTSDPAEGYNIEYRHFLEGYDKVWSSGETNGWIYYPDLPSGEYVFHAMVRNVDGTWSTNTIDVPFQIKRHPLLSSLAIAIYFALAIPFLIVIIYLISKSSIRRGRLKLAGQREIMAKQHIDYLTDISHELRLPLTLIYAPVRELCNSASLSEHESELMTLIEHNVDRMKVLTEQILESGKYASEKNTLKVASYNIGQVIQMVVRNYRFLALDKDISLVAIVPDDLDCWVDFEKVVKILNNLISNAVKYTRDGGHISVECRKLPDEGRIAISVTDNGIGVPKEKRDLLFGRFERLSDGVSVPDTDGSGVGLNYSQKLANIHKGIISYEPVESGGSCFTLIIPTVKAAYSDDEIFNLPMPYLSAEVPITASDSGAIKSQSVLIAEDDYQLLMYLESLFSAEWNVIGANDGLEAMDSMHQTVPDLVISDISMPRKDGLELCRDIKNNDDFSHVPVILLTALGDVKSRIAGLETGADAYIAKPFDPYYLLAESKTLVKNRKKIQRAVSNLTSNTIAAEMEQDSPILKESDRQFFEKLHSIIDANLSEEGFNASSLAREMNNSYSNFYVKLKNLTGESPQVYLNTYKMNRAMELLKAGDNNVSEVAFMTGFSAISNFSRSFKKKFGISPSEVK